ncbi:MAG: putative entry exclusion protein TrbK-alt [Pseudomonadota bacterium]
MALATILAAALLAVRSTESPTRSPPMVASGPDSDLARCRAAGEGASADPTCRQAWDAARDRFFGRVAP